MPIASAMPPPADYRPAEAPFGRRKSNGRTPAAPVLLSVPASINGWMGVSTTTMLQITETTLLYGRYEINLEAIESAVRGRMRSETRGPPPHILLRVHAFAMCTYSIAHAASKSASS